MAYWLGWHPTGQCSNPGVQMVHSWSQGHNNGSNNHLQGLKQRKIIFRPCPMVLKSVPSTENFNPRNWQREYGKSSVTWNQNWLRMHWLAAIQTTRQTLIGIVGIVAFTIQSHPSHSKGKNHSNSTWDGTERPKGLPRSDVYTEAIVQQVGRPGRNGLHCNFVQHRRSIKTAMAVSKELKTQQAQPAA